MNWFWKYGTWCEITVFSTRGCAGMATGTGSSAGFGTSDFEFQSDLDRIGEDDNGMTAVEVEGRLHDEIRLC
jgi:hypothetical protein